MTPAVPPDGTAVSAAASRQARVPGGELFVPALPTLDPFTPLVPLSLLSLLRGRGSVAPPFGSDDVVWYYLGRNAVYWAVRRLGLADGEILMPSYHHGVEVEAVIEAGARPRFYRVGRRWEVDLDDLEARIGPRTRALYLTHFAGFPGPSSAFRELADRRGLALIEDCALSLLSRDGEVPLGSTGDAAVYCLYKTLPVPHGGALELRNGASSGAPEDLAAEPRPAPLASTLSHSVSSALARVHLRAGAPGRALRQGLMALGRRVFDSAQVKRVAKGTARFDRRHVDLGMSRWARRIAETQDRAGIVERRRRNYRILAETLPPSLAPLVALAPGVCPLFYPLVVEDKDAVLRRLWSRGIEAIDFWSQSHPACDLREFEDVAWLRRRIVEIPCHQDLSPERTTRLAQAVRETMGR